MRQHPLLALFTTTATLAATGVFGHGWVPSSATTRSGRTASSSNIDNMSNITINRHITLSESIAGSDRTDVSGTRSVTDAKDVGNAPSDTVNFGATSRASSAVNVGNAGDSANLLSTLSRSDASAASDAESLAADLGHRDLSGKEVPTSSSVVAAITSGAVRLFLASDVSAAEPLAVELIIGSRGRSHLLPVGERHHAARLVQTLASATIDAGAASSGASGTWLALRTCESGNNYGANTGNGYYGAYQFAPSTWWWIGFAGLPDAASAAVQDRAARTLQARVGWGAWPVCSAILGLR